jgi:hypothetical protein
MHFSNKNIFAEMLSVSLVSSHQFFSDILKMDKGRSAVMLNPYLGRANYSKPLIQMKKLMINLMEVSN